MSRSPSRRGSKPARRASTALALAALLAAALGTGSLPVLAAAPSSEPAPSGPAPSGPAPSGPVPGTAAALLDALRLVPDTPATRAAPIGYVDFRAVEAARPGAATPGSYAELAALLESDDPSAELWTAAMMGVSGGTSDLLRGVLRHGGAWPDLLGFDFFDIDRQVGFGAPPSAGLGLRGDLDPEVIGRALQARDYVRPADTGHRLWCAAAGCDTGQRMDVREADPAIPFGGDLGQRRPMAVSATDLLVSADVVVLEGMIAARDGAAPSLADDPAFGAIAHALPDGATLLQATILGGGLPGVGPGIYMEAAGTPEGATALLAELDRTFEPMPAWEAAAFLDGATPSEQVVSIVLAYPDEADAAAAAEVLPRRLATLPSLTMESSLGDHLAERGVTSVAGRVVPGADGATSLAVVDLRAPLAGSDPIPDGSRPAPSSAVYQLLERMLLTRDVLWLAPVLPLE